MSWRQEASRSAEAKASPAAIAAGINRRSHIVLSLDTRHLHSSGTIQQSDDRVLVIPWIARLDTEEKPVDRRAAEIGNVKNRVIRLRQAVHCHHADRAGKPRNEDRALERDRNEHRPGDER